MTFFEWDDDRITVDDEGMVAWDWFDGDEWSEVIEPFHRGVGWKAAFGLIPCPVRVWLK